MAGMQEGDGTEDSWDVFLSHAGEQKDFVDTMYEMLTKAYHRKCFLDDDTLRRGFTSSTQMEKSLRNTSVGVVVITPEFVRKQWPMRELQILLESTRAQQKKALFAVFHGYDVDQCSDLKAFRALYETEPWVGGEDKPDDSVLDAWAKSVEELCEYCGVRKDQARHRQGKLAKLAVDGVIECLISIGKLPEGYNPKKIIPNNLARKTPVLIGREEELAWLRGRLCAPERQFPAALIRGDCGEGKSALAMELGMQLFEEGKYPGGAYLIDLEGSSPDTTGGITFKSSVRSMVADRLYSLLQQTQAGLLDEKTDWQKIEAWLRSSRGQLPMLVVFETTEDVLVNEDDAREFQKCWATLQKFPQVKLLAASRMQVPLPNCSPLELKKLVDSAPTVEGCCGARRPLTPYDLEMSNFACKQVLELEYHKSKDASVK